MKRLRITVEGRTYDVTVEVLSEQTAAGAPLSPNAAPDAHSLSASPPLVTPNSNAPTAFPGSVGPASSAAGAVVSPMAGAVKQVLVQAGAHVACGQALIVLEAMKMDNSIASPSAGAVKSIEVKEGDAVREGQVLVVVV